MIVGGKPKVEEAYDIFEDEYNNEKCIYICDADYDLILNRPRINKPEFIYLKKYEIENYFIDKESMEKILVGKIQKSIREINKYFDFNKWYDEVINSWYELMIMYIITQKNELDIKNTSSTPYKYFIKNSDLINEIMIQKYQKDLECKLLESGLDYDTEKNEVELRINELNLVKDDIVKGKYIMASAKNHIIKLMKKLNKKSTIANDDFYNMLLNFFNINSLLFLKERIEDVL